MSQVPVQKNPPANKPKPSSAYNPEAIASHFDEYGMREWDRLVETPVDEVSLYIHTHYLEAYVPAAGRVLEIGAGAGRFTQVLARLGARLVVADISPVQLGLNKQHAQRYGFAHAIEEWQQLDICDMSRFDSDSFDCLVAYGGPLSYVLDQRHRALQECLRVLKPGGLLLLSVMSLWGSAHRHLDGVLSLPAETNRRITHSGDLTPESMPGRGSAMHMFRADELRAWLVQAGLEVQAMSASNCLSLGWEEMLNRIRADQEKWGELLRMELEACAQSGCLDMGTHILAVARVRAGEGRK